jgi:hypothetical protein
LYHAHLRDNEVAVAIRETLFGNTRVFVAKYKGNTLGELEIVERARCYTKMGGVYFITLFSHGGHAFGGIVVLVNGEPFIGTGGTVLSKSFVAWNNCREHEYVLNAYCVAGAHNGRDVVRVVNVFHYYYQTGLAVVEDPLYFRRSFGGHNGAKI